jgi:hypothetical protein
MPVQVGRSPSEASPDLAELNERCTHHLLELHFGSFGLLVESKFRLVQLFSKTFLAAVQITTHIPREIAEQDISCNGEDRKDKRE